jgi:hypothetical protein
MRDSKAGRLSEVATDYMYAGTQTAGKKRYAGYLEAIYYEVKFRHI